MTTANQNVPTFPTKPRGHPALRATVILGLCAALLAGFIATSTRTTAPPRAAAQSTSVACDGDRAVRSAC